MVRLASTGKDYVGLQSGLHVSHGIRITRKLAVSLLHRPGGGPVKLLALLLALAGCGTAAVVTEPDALEIVRQSVVAMQADWREAPNYSYVQREIESKHESMPTKKTYVVVMIDGSPYRRLIALDGHPLGPGDQAEQDRIMQIEIQKRDHESNRERTKRITKYRRDRQREHDMIQEMVRAFQFRVVGEEILDGHNCWVLDTSPNPNYIPPDRESRVLKGMSGRLWIDKEQKQWVKASARVVKPVSFYGFLAKVGPGTRFVLEQEPVREGVWLPKRFHMQVNASALGFLNEDSTEEDIYRDYKPMSQTLAELQAR
jgi:hypothetical protein